jgi:hypothetical protein
VNQTTLDLDIENTPKTVNLVFARHETFHPRFGWLKKGFDVAKKDFSIFLQEDAPVKLGVGKNMVRSIRYWCDAFKITDNDIPTDFGETLLGEKGWDSFLEDPASLWLLHWNLLKPTCEAGAWYYVFNIFRDSEFTKEDILAGLKDYLKTEKKNISESSLIKDLTCILRMYTAEDSINSILEDSIDCPFTTLGLIRNYGKNYQFKVGSKVNLPEEIIVATCLEYANLISKETQTISISRLLYDTGSPGMVFKLNENALCSAIEVMARKVNTIMLSDTAGLIQLSFTEKADYLSKDILNKYYNFQSSK